MNKILQEVDLLKSFGFTMVCLWIAAVCIALSGCSTLKSRNRVKIDSIANQRIDEDRTYLYTSFSDSSWRYWFRDSQENLTIVDIVPEGKFNFNPETGFDGAASKVLISTVAIRTSNGVASATGTKSVLVDSLSIVNRESNFQHNKVDKTVRGKTSRFPTILFVGILLVCAAVIWVVANWILKNLKKF